MECCSNDTNKIFFVISGASSGSIVGRKFVPIIEIDRRPNLANSLSGYDHWTSSATN